MSEERERNIAFSEALTRALKMRGHGDCTDEESKFFTSGFIAGEKFASQVCEQREKVGFCEKHAPNPSQSYAGCWVCSRNEETELCPTQSKAASGEGASR